MTPSIFTAVLFHARQNRSAPAVLAGNAMYNYRELVQHVERVTQHLVQLRIAPGTRTGVRVSSVYLNWLLALALGRLGVPFAMAATPADMATFKPGLVITDAPAQWSAYRTEATSEHWFEDTPQAPLPPYVDRLFEDNALAQVILSSGTTGRSKMIPVTVKNMLARTRALAAEFGFTSGTRLLSTMGMTTAGGALLPFTCWSVGGCVLSPSVAPGKGLVTVLRSRPNLLFTATAQLQALVDGLPADFTPMPEMRTIVAGSVLPRAVNRRARMHLSPSLTIVYGSTEANNVAMAPAAHTQVNPRLTGYVLPTVQLEVVDGQGQRVPPGTAGEVRMKSPLLVDGYLDDAQATATSFRDGWFYPGDIGILGDIGDLSITGRSSEVINLGGVKIAPEAIEEALAGETGVTDIAAFSVSTPGGIDKPCLAVVAGEGFDREALAARFRKSWPFVKGLEIDVVDELPRNEMGKVMRAQLSQAFAARAGKAWRQGPAL